MKLMRCCIKLEAELFEASLFIYGHKTLFLGVLTLMNVACATLGPVEAYMNFVVLPMFDKFV